MKVEWKSDIRKALGFDTLSSVHLYPGQLHTIGSTAMRLTRDVSRRHRAVLMRGHVTTQRGAWIQFLSNPRFGCIVALMLALATVTSCRSLTPPAKQKLPHSSAVTPQENPAFKKTGATRSGESAARVSGVAKIDDGYEAFATRVALARYARQSLDIQYYIWEGDQTGTYLLSELLEAADRGVRVRLLLDDITSSGIVEGILTQLASGLRAATVEVEEGLALLTPDELERHDRLRTLMKELHTGGRDLIAAALNTHPNIEVRMFNPFNSRKRGAVSRMFQMVADFSRLNRRMHNKVFAADNQLAIVGGRNIADNYFGFHEKYDFRDLDLLLRGPAVRDVSASFDLYWNSEAAVPVHSFSWRARSAQRLSDLRNELHYVFRAGKEERLRRLDDDAATTGTLRQVTARMISAPVSVVADIPGKVDDGNAPLVAEALAAHSHASKKSIMVESAYFVPVDRAFLSIEDRIGHGVKVRILTNSMASTNQMPAHAGYFKHRKRLLQTGVDMYELRPYPPSPAPLGRDARGPRKVLHTKAVVFDGERVFVGTFNLDPRSADLNTEIGLLVESPKLAEGVVAFIEQGMQPEKSWRVSLTPPGEVPSVKGRLKSGYFWFTKDANQTVILRREPETRFRSRLLMRLVSWLPIDQLL